MAARPGSPERPLVFAHRGSSAYHAEHTLDAYLLAIEEGADGLECDVRLTRDGHLVCLHDSRLDRTSNGQGRVSLHTLADLDRLDFGSWHYDMPDSADGLIADRDEPGGAWRRSVLTLDRLLSVAVDAGRPIRLLIETKHPSRYGSAVETALIGLLRRYGLDRPRPDDGVEVTVMSFSPTAIRRVRQLAPDLPTVALIDVPMLPLRTGWLPFGTTIGGPGVDLLQADPRFADRLRRRGHQMYVWTVNRPHELELVIKLGADGIISDRPGYVLSELRSRGLRD